MGWQPECVGVGKLYIHGHPRQTISHGEWPVSAQRGAVALPGWEAKDLSGALTMEAQWGQEEGVDMAVLWFSLSPFISLSLSLTLTVNFRPVWEIKMWELYFWKRSVLIIYFFIHYSYITLSCLQNIPLETSHLYQCTNSSYRTTMFSSCFPQFNFNGNSNFGKS